MTRPLLRCIFVKGSFLSKQDFQLLPGYFQSPAEMEYGKKKKNPGGLSPAESWVTVGPGEPGSARRCSGSCLTLLSSPAPSSAPPARISHSSAAIRSFAEWLGVCQGLWCPESQGGSGWGPCAEQVFGHRASQGEVVRFKISML